MTLTIRNQNVFSEWQGLIQDFVMGQAKPRERWAGRVWETLSPFKGGQGGHPRKFCHQSGALLHNYPQIEGTYFYPQIENTLPSTFTFLCPQTEVTLRVLHPNWGRFVLNLGHITIFCPQIEDTFYVSEGTLVWPWPSRPTPWMIPWSGADGVNTSLHQKRVYTSLGSSFPQCVHQICQLHLFRNSCN